MFFEKLKIIFKKIKVSSLTFFNSKRKFLYVKYLNIENNHKIVAKNMGDYCT